MYNDDIKMVSDILKKLKYTAYRRLKVLNLLPKVVEMTSFLNKIYQNISWSQRFWHIKNNICEIVKCSNCKIEPAKYERSHGYMCCSKECSYDKGTKATVKRNLEEHGVECILTLNHIKRKSKNTCLVKYKVDNPAKNKGIMEKIKKTKIKNNTVYTGIFDEVNYTKTIIYKNKMRQTFINNLDDKYELIKYGKMLKLEHLTCGKQFIIKRTTFNIRKIRSHEYCILCNPTIKNYSHGEKEVASFIRSLYGDILENYRGLNWLKSPNTGCKMELDIFIPKLCMAFEYNSYYHTLPNVIERDKIKSKLCRENSIKLIIIWEKDWKNDNKKVKNRIQKVLLS